VQNVVSFLTGLLLLGFAVVPARATFTMLQVFGDGISSTTNNPAVGPYYYGKRYSNGRVWAEVLAQRQELALYPTNNWSYFGNTSTSMVATVLNYTAPSGVSMSNILFVIWVNNADLFYLALNNGTDMNAWTNAMNLSLSNHFKAITNLYQKGARTLIMPNVVDLSTVPQFNTSANTNFVHLRCMDYNVAFAAVLNRALTNSLYPGLTICAPDFFTLLTNILSYPTNYSVTNALYNGRSIDVIYDPTLSNKYTNGPGTNYIFWDRTDPSAKVHAWMANTAQQLLSPAEIDQLVTYNGSNRLVLEHVPVGQNGLVLGCTNLAQLSWKTNATFNGTNVTQSVYVVATNPVSYYRLRYLYSWTWP
jgi:outer membrane lipase/esterase